MFVFYTHDVWFQHLAALLLMGTGRNMISAAEYNRIRCILKLILEVDLPDLGATDLVYISRLLEHLILIQAVFGS